MLQVCLNGPRTRSECAHLPVTPRELAEAAARAVAAGAVDIHLHPKDRGSAATDNADLVRAAREIIRAAS